MEWNEKLQNIIDYVENHLQRKEEPINIDDIAKMAGRYYQKKISTQLLIMEVDFCPVLCVLEVPVLQAFRGISHFVWYCKAVSDLS